MIESEAPVDWLVKPGDVGLATCDVLVCISLPLVAALLVLVVVIVAVDRGLDFGTAHQVVLRATACASPVRNMAG